MGSLALFGHEVTSPYRGSLALFGHGVTSPYRIPVRSETRAPGTPQARHRAVSMRLRRGCFGCGLSMT